MADKFNISAVSSSFSKVLNEANSIISSKALSGEEIEAIYRLKEFQYRCEDAKAHCLVFNDEDEWYALMSEEDYENMAALFIEKYQDCNLDENSIWDNLIEDYTRDLFECC